MIVEGFKCKRENGDSITVFVNITEIYGQRIDFAVYDVQFKPKGTRKVISVRNKITDKSLRGEDRKKYIEALFLEYVSKEELQQAIKQAWHMIEPDTESLIIAG